MQKETISMGQAVSLITLFIMGTTMTMGTARDAKNDLWLAIMIAILATLPVMLMYTGLLTRFPGKNLFEVSELLLGKLLGKLVIFIFSWFALHVGSLSLRSFVEFVNIVALPETPRIVILLSVEVLVIWVVRAGVEVMGRSAKLMIIFVLFVLVVANLPAIPQFNPEFIKPILGEGLAPVLKGSFTAFAFPFAETIIIAGTIVSLEKKYTLKKAYLTGLFFGGAILLILGVRNLLMLDSYYGGLHYFPSYTAIGRIKLGDFIQRIEGLVDVVLLTCAFFKSSICLYTACKGFSFLFHYANYRVVATPLGILTVFLGKINFESSMEFVSFAKDIFPFYALPFEVFIPILLFIVYLVRKKAGKLPSPDNKNNDSNSAEGKKGRSCPQ